MKECNCTYIEHDENCRDGRWLYHDMNRWIGIMSHEEYSSQSEHFKEVTYYQYLLAIKEYTAHVEED